MLLRPQREVRAHSKITNARNGIIGLPRRVKQALMVFVDTAGTLVCVGLSMWLSLVNPVGFFEWTLLLVTAIAAVVVLVWRLDLYHSIVRYIGMNLVLAATKAAIGSAVIVVFVAGAYEMTVQPLQLALVFAAFCGIFLLGSRYIAQYFLAHFATGKEKVVIYGAGEAGVRVASAMRSSDSHSVIAFIDDDKDVARKVIHEIPVYPRVELERIIEYSNVQKILLAIPSVSRRRRANIIASLEPLGVHVQTIADLNDLITGKARVDELREVGAIDLLGRNAVEPVEHLLRHDVTNKSVMVTGAGGSIGSELCRQMLVLEPKLLVLFEISEAALYTIDKELRILSGKLDLDCHIVALLGTVEDQNHLREVMLSYGTDTVYHAAAYKHVPMVERNMLPGVSNNIFGTLSAAQAAVAAKVNTFVLVSTDKAVSPPNVMGATKRFAELILQAMQAQHQDTCFCMVRFGNVLESSGSVVPLFREQIQNGGPVTVTHPNIVRYFMTIPEAAQLVIQAGAMAKGGDVFVLDMGEPVRIQDLAKRMIRLSGLTIRDEADPDGDIDIEYTGLRPAEKMYEELLIGDNVTATGHPGIMRANEEYIAFGSLLNLLTELSDCLDKRDRHGVRELLKRAIIGYLPDSGIDDLLWERSEAQLAAEQAENIIPLMPRAG